MMYTCECGFIITSWKEKEGDSVCPQCNTLCDKPTGECEHPIIKGNIIRGFKCEICNIRINRKTFLKEYKHNALEKTDQI